jgi:ferric-dicitrate binding protein FerR (iron transport regulator)
VQVSAARSQYSLDLRWPVAIGGSGQSPLNTEVQQQSMLMGAGDVAQFLPSGQRREGVEHLPANELKLRLSWIDGLLSFNGQTLTQAAAEFNRYNQRQIVIADHRIAGLSVGGTFATTDPDSFVSAFLTAQPAVRRLQSDAAHPESNVIRLAGAPK